MARTSPGRARASAGSTRRRRTGTVRKTGSRPPRLSTYSAAIEHLLERTDYERMRVVHYNSRTFSLARMRRLLAALDDPHENLLTVHIAGTVGKGATAAMIDAMLRECGYVVGQFTSPHLIDVRERITVGGTMISRPDFTDLMNRVVAAAHGAGCEPTYFELLTAIAFVHFTEQAVDLAVVETGLGGRLDSTNVIRPVVSILTHIDIDHAAILGDTVEVIAREKAGILKRGVPAILYDPGEPVRRVLIERAERVGAPLRIIKRDIEFSSRFSVSDDLGPHHRICLITDQSQFMHVPVPLPGEHQASNCALALAALDVLKSSGFEIENVPLFKGLARTALPGRMEMAWHRPRILLDGAHNTVALGALMRSIGSHAPYDSMVCIFGCCEDKDVDGMLKKIALGGDKVIFTKARGQSRAMDPEDLQHRFSAITGKMSQTAHALPEAIEIATRAVNRDDLICITGSFYLVGEAKKHLLARERSAGTHR